MAQSKAEAEIARAGDVLDKMTEAFPEIAWTTRKARQILMAFGFEDGDVIDVVVDDWAGRF